MDERTRAIWMRTNFKLVWAINGRVQVFIGDAAYEAPVWVSPARATLTDEGITFNEPHAGVKVIPWHKLNLVSDKFCYRTDLC